jgi:hypothetical protein
MVLHLINDMGYFYFQLPIVDVFCIKNKKDAAQSMIKDYIEAVFPELQFPTSYRGSS